MKIIVLTPVLNEEWILRAFLSHASIYADHIVVADQNSTDDSANIARSFEKVVLLKNDGPKLNEAARQELLLTEARKFGPNNILIALDADEFLSPEFFDSRVRSVLLGLNPGDAISLRWANILPGGKTYRDSPLHPIIWKDDGSSSSDSLAIHRHRLPVTENSPLTSLDSVKVLHFQYFDWNRMRSKHRWYQVWERINFPNKSIIEIYRTYHHMVAWKPKDFYPVPDGWFDPNSKVAIPTNEILNGFTPYWWDQEVTELVKAHPDADFSGIDLAKVIEGHKLGPAKSKIVAYLRATQPNYRLQPPSLSGLFLFALDRAIIMTTRFWNSKF